MTLKGHCRGIFHSFSMTFPLLLSIITPCALFDLVRKKFVIVGFHIIQFLYFSKIAIFFFKIFVVKLPTYVTRYNYLPVI